MKTKIQRSLRLVIWANVKFLYGSGGFCGLQVPHFGVTQQPRPFFHNDLFMLMLSFGECSIH